MIMESNIFCYPESVSRIRAHGDPRGPVAGSYSFDPGPLNHLRLAIVSALWREPGRRSFARSYYIICI